MKWEFIGQPFSIMNPAVARISFCIYLLKFTGTAKTKRRILWFFIVTQVIVNLATMIEVLISCERYSHLWNPQEKGRCWSPLIQVYFGLFQGAWNSTTDFFLTFLPWFILRNLNMKLQTRTCLSILMGLSIFAMVACIVKTVELRTLGNRLNRGADFSYSTVRFVICFTLEQYFVIVIASIPTLRPLALKLHRRGKGCPLLRGWSSPRNASSGTAGQASIDTQNSWTARPVPVRLVSDQGQGQLQLEPPYVHPKPKNPAPPRTIRKTVSVYITSESHSQEIISLEERSGYDTTISVHGKDTWSSKDDRHTKKQVESWCSDTDLERQ